MSPEFETAFVGLRDLLLRAAPGMIVARDAVGDLMLQTPEVDPKTGEPTFFAAVMAKKAYVAFHLMPLYYHPEFLVELSPQLTKRRQGKTCFNFKRPDTALFAELETLVDRVVSAPKG